MPSRPRARARATRSLARHQLGVPRLAASTGRARHGREPGDALGRRLEWDQLCLSDLAAAARTSRPQRCPGPSEPAHRTAGRFTSQVMSFRIRRAFPNPKPTPSAASGPVPSPSKQTRQAPRCCTGQAHNTDHKPDKKRNPDCADRRLCTDHAGTALVFGGVPIVLI